MPETQADSLGEAANLGPFRPPLIYLAAIVGGLILGRLLPLGFAVGTLGRRIGGVTIIVAGVLFFAAVRTFRRAGTPVPGNRPTTKIVTHGPYRFSRNPIYLAFSLLQLGLALRLANVWLLVTLLGALALMSFVVIPREERYLEARFPAEYLPYRASVRRWL